MSAAARAFALAVAGGGTGGHVFPGIAVAREFRRQEPGTRVLFIGAAGRIEERLVPGEEAGFLGLQVQAVRGRGPAGALRGLLLAVRAVGECRRALAEFRADLLLGTGGYSSGPAAVAARTLGVPVVLQEQNTVPGMTNRMLGRIARRVFVAFEAARRWFPEGRAVVTGNPVRAEALGPPRAVGGGPVMSVLVLGGSQGARGLNRLVAASLAPLAAAGVHARFVHQSGAAGAEETAAAYRAAGVEAEVLAFVENVGERLSEADLVVARAGAGTVAEIAANGRPAILVPYPHAAGGHQESNARWLESVGGAIVVDERGPGAPERLAREVAALAADVAKLRAMAAASASVGVRDAAERIVAECRRMLGAG